MLNLQAPVNDPITNSNLITKYYTSIVDTPISRITISYRTRIARSGLSSTL
ncbi:conserved hypothetical protein [Treponema phagedenis]|uniref:Uncharacterized protein n=2 Tax=Treponema phagedenis TaxID=162 RepID=A0A0B7GY15_TREPH|nr:conserved hypothetical protein [Treponema phagedenis]